ncbi:hypothetical protein FKN90_08090 [Vibrio sp. 2017_1457_15]|nr:hypothetical protein [Vibrio sp. 2017_1457_15]MDQ2161331.1 hypothetical protein [Vibrio sp. 2017_1457_13]MDQ2189461.1 hypothetical protein [Vibrio sp. A14(2019)]NNN60156.1 hypothetical protein [Vibrio sp. A11]NNN82906.1 hypothetical protein [Vibrio sp. A8-1]
MTLLSRGSPSQLTLLVNLFVHTKYSQSHLFAVGFFLRCFSCQRSTLLGLIGAFIVTTGYSRAHRTT